MELSAANVATWRVAVALETDPADVPRLAGLVDPFDLRTANRRARLHLDAARGFHAVGQYPAAITELLQAERVSAGALYTRPAARDIVGHMARLYGTKTHTASDVAGLALRMRLDPWAEVDMT
jgi:hypothetical protein